MTPWTLPDDYSGAALVARGSDVVWTAAAGIADPATGRPCQVETPFNFASLGKMFVACTAVSLDVDLDQRAAPIVPELADAIGPATLRHLLSHTSGMGDIFDLPAYESRRMELRSLGDWLLLVAETRPTSAPGVRWIYSNAAFLAAAAVLERLTAESWDALVERQVFAPAGMIDTGYPPLVGPHAPQALAVPWSAELGGDAREIHVVRGTACGGGVSTVGDLHRFAVWLTRQPWREELWDPTSWQHGEGEDYGLGFFVDGDIVGHFGAFWGISARLSLDRRTGWIGVALANADPPIAEDAVKNLADLA